MVNDILLSKLSSICKTQENEKMSAHTTFRCGGCCDIMVFPETEEELAGVLVVLRKGDAPYMVIGNGSNLLVKDEGISGVVIKLGRELDEVRVDGERVVCGAGALLSKIANIALDNSLTGFEFAAGIPGSCGGAVFMNAGAYGGEMKDIVESVRYIDTDGTVKSACGDELDFSYRHSMFCENEELVITSVTIRLKKGNATDIKAVMDDLAQKRKEKQPLEYPSAGSTFKRPDGYFAAKLIDDAGLKGYSVGDAQVSEKHAGFVINRGNATADDVLKVIEHCKKVVWEKFSVKLETEIRIIGR